MQRSRTTPRGTVLLSDAAKKNQRLLNIRRHNGASRSYTSRHDTISPRSSGHITTSFRSSSAPTYQTRSYQYAGAPIYPVRTSLRACAHGDENRQRKETSEHKALGLRNSGAPGNRASNPLHSGAHEDEGQQQKEKSGQVTTGSRYSSAPACSLDTGAHEDIDEQPKQTSIENLDNETKQARGSVSNLKDKHDYLAADFDDFELKMKRTREKMKSLLNKHDDVHERLQSDGSSREDDGKHWEYFQQQNKLLSLAVSKLCRQEGIDVADLSNGKEPQWRFRRGLSEEGCW